jgi:site-specific recombinase XerD
MTEEHKQLLSSFIEEGTLKGRTSQSLRGFRNRVPMFFRFIEAHGLELRQVRANEAGEYQRHLVESEKHYKNNTVRSYLTAVSSFYDWLKKKSLVYANPFLEIRWVRQELKIPRNILKEEQMHDFLISLQDFNDAVSFKEKVSSYKLHLIAELLYSTGLRISEAGSLRLADIDLDRGLVKVTCGKGQKERIAFLNDYCCQLLRTYINDLRELILNDRNQDNDLLFGVSCETFKGFVNRKLREKCRTKGVQQVKSHDFRHAVGFHLLRSGCDVRYIQAILGHDRLHSTEIYTKVEKEDLKRVLNQYHPRQFQRSESHE